MSFRTKAATARHEKLRNDLLAILKKEAADMRGDEILAVVCVLVGQLIALQDQRRFTPEMVMKLVSANIEAGNRGVVTELMTAPGGKA